MNSWRLSSVMCPVRVRKSIPANHSSSVSSTSEANAWRCATRLWMISWKRSELQLPRLLRTACVSSSSARLRVLNRPLLGLGTVEEFSGAVSGFPPTFAQDAE